MHLRARNKQTNNNNNLIVLIINNFDNYKLLFSLTHNGINHKSMRKSHQITFLLAFPCLNSK